MRIPVKTLGALIVLASTVYAQAGMTEDQVRFYADAAMKAEAAAQKANRVAVDQATYYEQAAELRVRQKMDADPQHRSAAETVATATRVLNESRQLNNPQLQVAASSQFNQADEALKKMEADAMAADLDVQAAKSILARLQGAASVPPSPGLAAVAAAAQPVSSQQPTPNLTPVIPPQTPPVRRKLPTTIELGMSREELVRFVEANRTHFKVIRFSSERPAGYVNIDTTVNEQASGTTTIAGSGLKAGTATAGIGATGTNGTASVMSQGTRTRQSQAKISGSKIEYVTIQTLEAKQVVVSVKRAAFGGGTESETEPRLMPTGEVAVKLVDDVVSAINAR